MICTNARVYTDKDEWSTWPKIGVSVLHIALCRLRRWAAHHGYCLIISKCIWQEPHLMLLDELGITLVPHVSKRLACRDYGNGAMAEPSFIFSTVNLLKSHGLKSGSNSMQ
ncbi:hypothetical protein RHMOL_Rhmol12G0203000 [Rhododendron molle]|uniref:Uncharacterized protein n=1 Tax=Rhododendron molle TaxID=49168 RepID=A0ACC0LLV3_RHOML|nr:hypothetical protein RHMOL_Rhmol12G0203000 [Rhododendron molle]